MQYDKFFISKNLFCLIIESIRLYLANMSDFICFFRVYSFKNTHIFAWCVSQFILKIFFVCNKRNIFLGIQSKRLKPPDNSFNKIQYTIDNDTYHITDKLKSSTN